MTTTRAETYSVIIGRDPVTNRIHTEQWRGEDGRLHRLGDQPADLEYCIETGRPVRLEWRVGGRWHREGDQPAIVLIDPATNQTCEVRYFKNGLEHRESGPSRIVYNPLNGIVVRREWRQEGCCTGGEKNPSIIEYEERNGIPVKLIFCALNDIHRRTGPAIIELDAQSGGILRQHFYLSGELREPPSMTPLQP